MVDVCLAERVGFAPSLVIDALLRSSRVTDERQFGKATLSTTTPPFDWSPRILTLQTLTSALRDLTGWVTGPAASPLTGPGKRRRRVCR